MSALRDLPFLRSRSNLEFGFYLAIASILLFACALFAVTYRFLANPSDGCLATGAGLGGAAFVSYSVQWSGIVSQLRRGRDSETLTGLVTGLGFCGFFGAGAMPILMAVGEPFGWPARLVLCWAACSIVFLGGLVATLPLFAYDDSRIRHLNRDE